MQKPEPFVNDNTIFSVSDAANLLKKVVETAFPVIKIRGELSQITRATSGHTYMTIKDSGAAMSVIIWRGTPVKFALTEGLEVVITGRLTTYPARSNYQMVASDIEMAGVGAILKMLEERKQKLAAEGLFDVARKKTLPKLPQTIGVVTSPTGAAFQDIQNRLRERFPVRVILYPATVQGETAAAEVAAGVEYFNRTKNVDVIIVARGGGSLEDLLPFSEEIVVRAVANSEIPVITGVGHEPDWMLVDFAADFRAPTPTGAAEAVVPTKLALIQDLDNLGHRITTGFTTRLTNTKQRITAISIKSPKQMVMERTQRIDDVARTLGIIINAKMTDARAKMNTLTKMPDILTNKMQNLQRAIEHNGQMLNSLGYKNVLARGYAIVRDSANNIISSAANADKIANIEFADGVANMQ